MKVYLYILNTLSDWEIGYITSELNSGRFLDKKKVKPELIKIGVSKEAIMTMGGLKIIPDKTIDEITFNEGDVLILPGADTWGEENNLKIINLIPKLLAKNITVAAICGATIALANIGALDNKKHTSNDKDFLKMISPNYKGEDLYVKEPAVTDGNLITASGIAPLEFSNELFKKMDVMKNETLEAWYKLNKTQDSTYFYDLINSLKD